MQLPISDSATFTSETHESWGLSGLSSVPSSAYIHIPFCRHRCGYCNFSLMANRADLVDRFLDALNLELAALEEPRTIHTLFLGGGTPSILAENEMGLLLKMLREWLPLQKLLSTDTNKQPSPIREWSIEANPLDITPSFCSQLAEAGVNRISIGGQSFQASKLKNLERDHSPEQLLASIEIARSFFPSVSLDLIFASPGETLDGWLNDLRTAVESKVSHISTYGLTFEKGSKFWGRRAKNEIQSLPESLELEMYEQAIELLCRAGMEHYEVSNFAIPGHACQHNQTYWNGEPWWAFGPSAARYLGNVRSVNHRGTLEYMRRVERFRPATDETEVLSEEQQSREKFVFGMRRIKGINWTQFQSDSASHVVRSIEASMIVHCDYGWLERDGDYVRLSRKGLLISDALWGQYL